LTNDLRQAIAKQAILDHSNGKITKAEALLRWHHPNRGAISPMTFI